MARCVFPTPGGPGEEQRGVLPDPLAGGQGLDLAPLDPRLEGPVEVGQRLARGQTGEPEAGLHAALLALGRFQLEELIEEPVSREVLLRGCLDELRQTLGREVEAEIQQCLAGLVEVHAPLRHGLGGHRATSARAA